MNEPASPSRRIELYDTTLRDGTQGIGVTLSLADKLKIARMLDEMGFDFIEGGYPLSNPKDVAFFEEAAKMNWRHARICAFGMTRRKGIRAADDPGMQALVNAQTPVVTIVGKTWDLHVDEVLRVSRDENLAMIEDSVGFVSQQLKQRNESGEVFYDAEHFFDGYQANPEYALQTLNAAVNGGATRLVLCDTNGGSLPQFIRETVTQVQQTVGDDAAVAIHTHNDGGLAVINSLEAVEAGAVQVQGTINGIGERCGNVDLTTVAANLQLKLGYDCLKEGKLAHLTELSRFVYEMANMNLSPNQPYVGTGAFAHKGGMHVHAVQRLARSYEHVEPEVVGNARRVLVSELSGASNIAATLGRKFDIEDNKDLQRKVLSRVQDLENEGYQFEAALASFELLLYEAMGRRKPYFDLEHYRCVIFKHDHQPTNTEAIVKLFVDGEVEHRVAEGDGPVDALTGALRKALAPHYPQIEAVKLTDYKVRVVNPTAGTAARVRVTVDFVVADENESGMHRRFTTIGVDENIVDASWKALVDAFDYHLLEQDVVSRMSS